MAEEIDHCTNWPDRFGSWDWAHCCQVHDLQYDLQVDKLTADLDLFTCVAQAGAPVMAAVMYVGVLALGGKYYINAKKKRKSPHEDER